MKLKKFVPVLYLVLLLSAFPTSAQEPVPLPCDPAVDCPPIDPCKIAPEKCEDTGGPIEGETSSRKCQTECEWGYVDGTRCKRCCQVCDGEIMECEDTECEL